MRQSISLPVMYQASHYNNHHSLSHSFSGEDVLGYVQTVRTAVQSQSTAPHDNFAGTLTATKGNKYGRVLISAALLLRDV